MYTTVIVPKRSDDAAMVYSVPVIRRNYSLLASLLLDLFLNSNSIFLKLSEFNYHIIKKLNPVGSWVVYNALLNINFTFYIHITLRIILWSVHLLFSISMLPLIIIAFRINVSERQLSKFVLLFICKAISVFLNSKVST